MSRNAGACGLASVKDELTYDNAQTAGIWWFGGWLWVRDDTTARGFESLLGNECRLDRGMLQPGNNGRRSRRAPPAAGTSSRSDAVLLVEAELAAFEVTTEQQCRRAQLALRLVIGQESPASSTMYELRQRWLLYGIGDNEMNGNQGAESTRATGRRCRDRRSRLVRILHDRSSTPAFRLDTSGLPAPALPCFASGRGMLASKPAELQRPSAATPKTIKSATVFFFATKHGYRTGGGFDSVFAGEGVSRATEGI